MNTALHRRSAAMASRLTLNDASDVILNECLDHWPESIWLQTFQAVNAETPSAHRPRLRSGPANEATKVSPAGGRSLAMVGMSASQTKPCNAGFSAADVDRS